jgi:hypothetical protein
MEVTAMILSMFPALLFTAAWIVVVVFAVKMIRNGGKPEKFLLIGACLMLASSLLAVAAAGLNPWIVPKLVEAGTNRVTIASVFGFVGIFRACISLAGIVLLVLAFWWKFKTAREPAPSE